MSFAAADGGLLCADCGPGDVVLDDAALAALRDALALPLAQAPEPQGRAARQVDRVVSDLAQHHLGVRLRGLRIP